MTSGNAGPLVGIRVIELGSFIAGPYCGQLLADLGADVIKVEPPRSGDVMRVWGLKNGDRSSVWWDVIGRNKRSLVLDLHNPKARDILLGLLRDVDVVVENFRPGTLEKWGLSPDLLRAENPRLIVARVSGYGQTGPYKDRGGFAASAEALTGLRTLVGYPDRPPTRVGLSIGDSLAGIFAVVGILASIIARQNSGAGQVVDVSIVESILAVMESVIAEFSALGAIRQRTGSFLPGIAPSNLYPTSDGAGIVIAANGDGLFRRLCEAMARPDLASSPRFATHVARGENQAELDGIVAAWTAGRTSSELVEIVNAVGVPCAPVNDAAGVCRDPHFRARGAVVEVDSPNNGRVSMQGVVPQFSDTKPEIRWSGPMLGEHTAEILRDRLQLADSEIEALRAEGAIQ
jgi:crotonobetainyl-CoA:carnitine CoA-transferase CaiB-like acyl-CoA transferase